jgi:two-component system sensor histidine kinase MtrB
MRFRLRLIIAFILVAGVAAGALAIGSYLLVSRARFAESQARAGADVRYQLVLAQQFLPLTEERGANLLASFESSGHHVVLVTDSAVAASSADFNAAPDTDTRSAAAAGQIVFERVAGHLLLVGGQIPGSGAQLYVVHEETGIYDDLGVLATTLAVGWAVVVLVAAVVGGALARRTLEPVARASAAAHAVAEGLLATRLPVRGRDEFGAWAESFNRMAGALEANIARERRFTADVAHELRTPVTALVAAASLLREHLDAMPVEAHRPAELVVTDVMRLRRLVDDLMEISRLDAGQEDVVVHEVDIQAAVAGVVATRGWQETVAVQGISATVETDPRRLDRILANLIANAVEHGGRDVSVSVTAGASPGAAIGTVRVTVTDRGPGIAAEHLPRLFERFYKADPARTRGGSGLGLAIAQENARLIGAHLEAASEPGHGTEFRLELPVTHRLPDGEATLAQRAQGRTA